MLSLIGLNGCHTCFFNWTFERDDDRSMNPIVGDKDKRNKKERVSKPKEQEEDQDIKKIMFPNRKKFYVMVVILTEVNVGSYR